MDQTTVTPPYPPTPWVYRFESSLSTELCLRQVGEGCRCAPPGGRLSSHLGDTMEEEEVQRDPRAGSASLVEEAQVRYTLLFSRIPISQEL